MGKSPKSEIKTLDNGVFAPLTFVIIQQSDLKAVPAGFLRVEDHSQIRVGSQKGRFHLLSITPIHSSALTARNNRSIIRRTSVQATDVIHEERG